MDQLFEYFVFRRPQQIPRNLANYLRHVKPFQQKIARGHLTSLSTGYEVRREIDDIDCFVL